MEKRYSGAPCGARLGKGKALHGRAGRRSGQAYSFIVILIIIPLLLFITGFLAFNQSAITTKGDKILSDQMAQVAKNTEEDFARAVQVAGRRALLAQVNYIVLTGSPIDNATFRTGELMLNGSLYGNASIAMFNNTLEDWRQRILATAIGFNRNISFGGMRVENIDGFTLRVSLDLGVNLSHPFSQSRVEKSVRRNVSVSVEGLEDPLFILNSKGSVQKQVFRYPYRSFALKVATGTRAGNCTGAAVFTEDPGLGKVFVVYNASGIGGYEGTVSETPETPNMGCYSAGNPGAVASINATVQEQNYTTLTLDEMSGVWLLPLNGGLAYYSSFPASGPDFLRRLEGRLDASQNGLESFVLDAAGITQKPGQSRVDYQYFSNATIAGQAVRGLPSWFRIDSAGAERYNLSELG